MFDEKTACHFLTIKCRFPIPEEALKEALEDPEAKSLSQIPFPDSNLCLNCLLGFIVLSTVKFKPQDSLSKAKSK